MKNLRHREIMCVIHMGHTVGERQSLELNSDTLTLYLYSQPLPYTISSKEEKLGFFMFQIRHSQMERQGTWSINRLKVMCGRCNLNGMKPKDVTDLP